MPAGKQKTNPLVEKHVFKKKNTNSPTLILKLYNHFEKTVQNFFVKLKLDKP